MQPVGNLILLAAVGGMVVGSFLNVVALRWYNGRGLRLSERSACPHCRASLRWHELVPVISYLLSGARCQRCRSKISPRYLLVELGFGLVAAAIVASYGSGLLAGVMLVLSAILLISLLIDLEYQLLPDELTVLAGLCAMLGLLVLQSQSLVHFGMNATWESWWVGGGISGGFLGLLYILTSGRGMGLGDVKLAFVLGLSLGGIGAGLMLGIAFITGAVVGVVLLLLKRARWKSALPFGPFLIVGWWATLLWGPALLAWYTELYS